MRRPIRGNAWSVPGSPARFSTRWSIFSTLSRFENGHQALSYKRVSALLQRLGLPDGRLYLLMSEDELALETAEREARCASASCPCGR